MIKRLALAATAILGGGAAIHGTSSEAADRPALGLAYDAEWQTDFSGGYDLLNLLQLSADLPLYKSLTLSVSTLSIAKTGAEPLVEDLLTYSNIEAGNIPLTISRLGVAFTVKDAELFAGISNVNVDYFTTPLTSFFTNSSCGISPTISCNYDIANYPVSAWSLHYRQSSGPLTWQTSLYPGQGYSRLLGHRNLFSLNLKRDGIFSISSIEYAKNGINCTLGIAMHYGHPAGYEDAEPSIAPAGTAPGIQAQKKYSAAPWLMSEITLPSGFGLLAHASCATVASGCKAYGALGLIYEARKVQPGVCVNYAYFKDAPPHSSETAVELTCRIPVYADIIAIQPSLHIIAHPRDRAHCIGLIRLNATI